LKKPDSLKLLATIVFLLFGYSTGYAQLTPDSTVINIAAIAEAQNINTKVLIYIDSTGNYKPEDALKNEFTPLLKFTNRLTATPEMVPYRYFLKFTIENSDDTARHIYVYPGALFDNITIFKLNNNPDRLVDSENLSGFKSITLSGKERSSFLVCLKFVKNEISFISTQLINPAYLDTYKMKIENRHMDVKIFGYILSGVLLMMILFMLANLIITFRKEFLYNALYSICMFSLVFLNSYTARTSTPFNNFFLSYLDFLLLVLGTIFYILFTRSFLNTPVQYKLLDKVLKYGMAFITMLLGVYTYLNFFTRGYLPQYWLETVMKLLILILGVCFIVLAIRQRNRLLNYLAAGNAGLVIFSSISLALILATPKLSSLFFSSVFYYNLGIVIELAFFLLGLTYKNRSEIIERIKNEEAMKLETERKDLEAQISIIKAQQEERNRISADMHDDLGAGMTTIRLYSELAKRKLQHIDIPEIDKISSSANELLIKMNAIIWSMSSSNDTLGNMTSYIRSYALEYFENTGINCHIHIPDDLPNVVVIGTFRRNVFLVVKEALNNILKHSKATEVNINLVRIGLDLIFTIHDNGVGIDFDHLRQFSNGLKNMRKRMEDLDITFNIENDNGTFITLRRRIDGFKNA